MDAHDLKPSLPSYAITFPQSRSNSQIEIDHACEIPSGANSRSRDTSLHIRKRSHWRNYLHDKVKQRTLLEVQLYLLAFATGIQDATTFPGYHCFASKQTGNTVLLAVRVFGIGGDIFNLLNIGISLLLFVFGTVTFGQLGNLFGPRQRWWLLGSSVLQTVMVLTVTGLQYGNRVVEEVLGKVVIALLAMSSGAQVAMVRSLKITDITTAMAPAAYIDIFIDPKIFEWKNHSRNRRLFFLASLVAGSFAGASWFKKMGSAFTLLLSALGKLLVAVLFCFNTAEDST